MSMTVTCTPFAVVIKAACHIIMHIKHDTCDYSD